MLTVKQAADHLGVSQARIRKMIVDGVLPAEKFGSNWSIPDTSVIRRVSSNPGRGRPKKKTEKTFALKLNNPEVFHYLYCECKENLSNGYDIDALLELETQDERNFCVSVTDFFLQQKQRQLIKQGVF